jgi:tetratricopeptide (TPR) repeat protein
VWILLGATLAGTGCNSDSRQLFDRAQAQWREGNYDAAIELDRLLYERDPQGKLAPKALLNVGNISYLNLRKIKDAVDAYTKLIEEFPGRPEELKARLQLADIYENEIVDLTQAVAEYDRILEFPGLDDRLEIQFKRANVYFKMEDYNRALRELRRMEEAGVTGHLSDQVFLKIGNIYQIQRKYEDAADYLARVEQSPCPECRRNAIVSLAETYEALYDIPHAIETIRKLDHTPENDRQVAQEVARLTEKRRRLGSTAMTWHPAPAAKADSSRASKTQRSKK